MGLRQTIGLRASRSAPAHWPSGSEHKNPQDLRRGLDVLPVTLDLTAPKAFLPKARSACTGDGGGRCGRRWAAASVAAGWRASDLRASDARPLRGRAAEPADDGSATASPMSLCRAVVAGRGWAFAYSASSAARFTRSEEHTSELQSQSNLVCRLLLEKKKKP